MPQPVAIEGDEGWEVEKIMNKRKVRGRDKYFGAMEGIDSRKRHLGKQKESKEHNEVGRRIQEGI